MVKKLDARAIKGTMMRYSAQSKGYKLRDVQYKKFVVSGGIYFVEVPD